VNVEQARQSNDSLQKARNIMNDCREWRPTFNGIKANGHCIRLAPEVIHPSATVVIQTYELHWATLK
jgi:hypothetical protein